MSLLAPCGHHSKVRDICHFWARISHLTPEGLGAAASGSNPPDATSRQTAGTVRVRTRPIHLKTTTVRGVSKALSV
jgi:hypothetical protein